MTKNQLLPQQEADQTLKGGGRAATGEEKEGEKTHSDPILPTPQEQGLNKRDCSTKLTMSREQVIPPDNENKENNKNNKNSEKNESPERNKYETQHNKGSCPLIQNDIVNQSDKILNKVKNLSER